MISKALVLGGGVDQLPGVIELSTLNYFTIVVDKNNDCVCKNYCSVFINISSKNSDKILSELRRLGFDLQVTYILVIGTDIPHIAAELAQH